MNGTHLARWIGAGWMGVFVCWAALAIGLASTARAEGDAVAAWQAAREASVARLEAHAAWCDAEKLRGERNLVYEALILLQPDHARARRGLKFLRGKDGAWTRKSYRTPGRTRDAAKAAEASRRLTEAAASLRAAVVALREEEGVSVAARAQAVAELALILVDDVEVRGWNGETKLGSAWALRETATTLKEGRALRSAILRILAEQPQPDETQPDEDDAAFVRDFADGSENAFVRVLAMRGSASSVEAARVFAAVRPAFTWSIGVEPTPTLRTRVLLYAKKEHGVEALGRDTSVDAACLAWAGGLASVWSPSGGDLFIWADSEEQRIEWCLRQALQVHLRVSLGVTEKRGWAYEGVGHWLSEAMLGSHLSWYVRQDGYSNQAGGRGARFAQLLDPKQAWLQLGADLATGPDWPDLRVLLGRDVNTMSADELLVSYLLARFLIEGRPDDIHGVLRDVGAAKSQDAWCAERLGLSIEQLDGRLRRWVGEVAERL